MTYDPQPHDVVRYRGLTTGLRGLTRRQAYLVIDVASDRIIIQNRNQQRFAVLKSEVSPCLKLKLR